MDPDTPPGSAGPAQIAAAFAVHVFTACGAGCALLALIAAVNSEWPIMFAWLGAALCIGPWLLPAGTLSPTQQFTLLAIGTAIVTSLEL